MKEVYIELKDISRHFYLTEYIYEHKETKEKSTLYNNGQGEYFVLIEPFLTDASGN